MEIMDPVRRTAQRRLTNRSHNRAPTVTAMARRLEVGDRVRVFGGYDMDPPWLAGHLNGYTGEVIEFIPGQNHQPAAVLQFDEELVLPEGAGAVDGREVRGRFVVLELGHVGTDWATPRPRIHVELCEGRPPPIRWQDRRQGAWVESLATYEVLPRHHEAGEA
jgi:hypothetical protein